MNEIKADVLIRIMEQLWPLLDRRALVIFTGGAADHEALLATVDNLLLTEARIVASPAFLHLAPESFIKRIEGRMLKDGRELLAFMAGAHLAAVPVLTRNTMIKAALGLADSLVTNAIAGALMRNVPLVGVTENYHPHSAHSLEAGYGLNPAYSGLLLEHERRLKSLGAILVGAGEFSETVKNVLYPRLRGK